jgi:hypothetical protein
MQLLSGTLEVSKENIINSDALPTNYNDGLILGEGGTYSDYDMTVEINPGAKLLINSGVLNYKNIEIYNPIPLIPPGIPLKIGDAIAIKHKTYGFYVAPLPKSLPLNADFYTDMPLGRDGPIESTFYWMIRPGDELTAWGSPSKIGNIVKSGDLVHLTNHVLYGIGRDIVYSITDTNAGSHISSPNPPYNRMFLETMVDDSKSTFHIYKNGAAIGDQINHGDDIYFHRYRFSGSWFQPVDSGISNAQGHAYLGSANLVYNIGKDIFTYAMGSSTSQPPNFSTNFIWNIEQVLVDAHLTAPSNPAWSDHQFVDFSGWPAASLTQF